MRHGVGFNKSLTTLYNKLYTFPHPCLFLFAALPWAMHQFGQFVLYSVKGWLSGQYPAHLQ